jgi:hypothetical protein
MAMPRHYRVPVRGMTPAMLFIFSLHLHLHLH